MGSNSIIKIESLVKKYQDTVAVDNISFEVKEGEIFGLLGPNGAGKTTTMEIIETLRKPTSGVVIVNGFDVIKNPWDIKRSIGVQLQSAGFYPELTLVDLLKMFADLYGIKIDPVEVLKKILLGR